MTAMAGVATAGLARTLTVRLVITTLVVMLLQASIVSVRDYFNETDFLSNHVKREAQLLASEYAAYANEGSSSPAESHRRHYEGPNAAFYAYRITDALGAVLAEHNPALMSPNSPWTGNLSSRQEFWIRKLDSNERMHVAGGLKIRRDGNDLWIELATRGDPDGTYMRTIALDIFDDVWIPILPLVLLSLAVTNASVRRSLAPLAAAATRADAISILERSERLDLSKLPAEASHFASAINRLLDRVADLISTQRLFIARAAHELRTPLSIMMLELGHLNEPSSKRLETDVRAMSEIVDQLLLLARLEATPKSNLGLVDVSTVVRELVGRLMAWAEKDGHRLTFQALREKPILGEESAIKEAVRNLIENAVKHTPPGTEISIVVGRDASIVVEDSGPGLGSLTAEEVVQPFRKGSTTTDGAGLGLAIVRQAAELHGGSLDVGRSHKGGARFVIRFPDLHAVAGHHA